MASDYKAIRTENIDRYGWDPAVLELLGQLYSKRTHFIFELLQNAEDAGASELTFDLFGDRLEVRHDGRIFNEADVRGVCGVAKGTKAGDLTQIGKFGIGFKSVYAYTGSPRIHSGDEHFRIEKYVRPFAAEPLTGLGSSTLFVFPFDGDEPSAVQAVAEISDALADIDLTTLLFLRSLERVRVQGTGMQSAVLERVATERPSGGRHILLAKWHGGRASEEEWLAWQHDLDSLDHAGQRVEIAFRLDGSRTGRRILPADSSPLVVFFPTQKETFLGFLMQGPFRTTPARDNIPEHDPWNQALVRETAAMLRDVLCQLRLDVLMTVDALQAMPLDAARFQPGTMFRPVFDAVRAALAEEQLIPVSDGGHATAADLKLARGTGLRELLSPRQLSHLYGGTPGASAMHFADEAITQDRTPELWRYLREELGVDEVTPQSLASRLTREFLAAQTDQWIADFYEFLQQNPAVWRAARYRGDQPGPARGRPIIRLEDGSHVSPFDDSGEPAAYLPGPIKTTFPTVRRAVADYPEARKFLEALGLSVPDAVAEVLTNILPLYRYLDVQYLNWQRHQAHLESISLALSQAPAGRLDSLRTQLKITPFLVAENAVSGKRQLMKPPEIYRRTAALEMYFDGNPDAWFLDGWYEPWLDLLAHLGVRQNVAVRARSRDYLGNVVVVDYHGLHERGLDGFDPGATIDGLDCALASPNLERSEYVWNALLTTNRHLISGVVEKAGRQDYSNAIRSTVLSVIGTVATTATWLPGQEGAFHRPGELPLSALPASYARDDLLARALNMLQPVIEEASRVLDVPAHVLKALSEHPDLIAIIEKELRARQPDSKSGRDGEFGDDDAAAVAETAPTVNYAAELSAAFGRAALRPENTEDPSGHVTGGLVDNPALRRERTREGIQEDISKEPALRERFRRVSQRVWDAKDEAVRHFLLEQYDGRCQICASTFRKRDGTPYFEGIYLVGRTRGQWLDRPGNVVALCATCCAKFQHGSVEAPDITDQIDMWRTRREGGSVDSLALRLCGEKVELRFTERHLLDLQEILRAALDSASEVVA